MSLNERIHRTFESSRHCRWNLLTESNPLGSPENGACPTPALSGSRSKCPAAALVGQVRKSLLARAGAFLLLLLALYCVAHDAPLTTPDTPAVKASTTPMTARVGGPPHRTLPRIRFVRSEYAHDQSLTNAIVSVLKDSAGTNRPYRLNFESLVHTVFTHNTSVRASREEMMAGNHALTEFRANLSRLEPYVEAGSDLSEFPNRHGAFGNTVETVAGVRKESFGGAVFSTEMGASHSRFEFDRAVAGSNPVESGAGALLRARIEVPFFGSRRRQDRIISQAFQDATARRAQLDYLKSFRSQVADTISYYNQVVFWQRSLDNYDRWMASMDLLLRDPRLRESDRLRIETARTAVESNWNHVASRQEDNFGTLLSFLGTVAEAEVEVEMPSYRLSPFVDQARQEAGVRSLIQQARENNPAFRILKDAIKNARLQRDQAVRGRYDVTTFLEGTTFPLGSETFDNRYQGWTVGGGVNVRLNDHRVLKATRAKAEAQIRQFEAEMETEEISIRQRIISHATTILANDKNRQQLLAASGQLEAAFVARREEYFAGSINIDQLLSARADVAANESSLFANLQLTAEREALLSMALGEIYSMVGLQIDGNATQLATSPTEPDRPKPLPAVKGGTP